MPALCHLGLRLDSAGIGPIVFRAWQILPTGDAEKGAESTRARPSPEEDATGPATACRRDELHSAVDPGCRRGEPQHRARALVVLTFDVGRARVPMGWKGSGVGNGVRTRDFRSHSPALYH